MTTTELQLCLYVVCVCVCVCVCVSLVKPDSGHYYGFVYFRQAKDANTTSFLFFVVVYVVESIFSPIPDGDLITRRGAYKSAEVSARYADHYTVFLCVL